MSKRERLDKLLVLRGLANSQTQAQAHILAGDVIVNEQRVDKPGTLVADDASLRLRNKLPYVSRGALKLKGALLKWPTQVLGSVCMDVGASTGGFTDLLLQEGAKEVYAIDVGHNQLAYSLRQDPRVHVMERTHILHLDDDSLIPRPNLAVVDVSFISLSRVLPKIAELIDAPGIVYALIKPQFEVGAQSVEKGGIVRDEPARLQAVHRIIEVGMKAGLTNEGFIESPIQGADGNIEYLALFRKTKESKK